eukprot:gene7920-8116_t
MQAVFVQQGREGLTLCAAHAAAADTGVLVVSVLNQAVFGVCAGPEPWQHSAAHISSWRCLSLIFPGADSSSPFPWLEQQSPQQQQEQPEQQQALGPGSAWGCIGQLQLSAPPSATNKVSLESSSHGQVSLTALKLCWHPEGLPHVGAAVISSMTWLPGAKGLLAVIDSWGRLCLLTAGAMERLQLMDSAGMTITFKPTVQLDFSTLLAASRHSKHAPVAKEHHLFLLAPVWESPADSSAGSTRPLLAVPRQQQLLVFDGQCLLLCSLYPGIDPSQRRINQSLNARALLLYGTGSSVNTNSNNQALAGLTNTPHLCWSVLCHFWANKQLIRRCAPTQPPYSLRYSRLCNLAVSQPRRLLLCQYQTRRALSLIQQLLADLIEAWQRKSGGEDNTAAGGKLVDVADVALDFSTVLPGAVAMAGSTDGQDQRAAAAHVDATSDASQMLHLATKLLAAAIGITADSLLAALRVQGPGEMSGGSLDKLPCMFPTPDHWTMWLKDNVQQQKSMPGMAVQLQPGPLLEDLHSSVSGAAVIRLTSLHAARDVAVRAAGLLLMSEVLAAAVGVTGDLQLDVPELLADALTQVTCSSGRCGAGMQSWGRPLWKHAAVLSVSCGAVAADIWGRAPPMVLINGFDEAARSVLLQHVFLYRAAPLNLLAAEGVAAAVVAASLWPQDHPCLTKIISQILGLLGQALVLQVLALPVLPPLPVAPGGSEQASAEIRLVQMLLHQAIPQATADMLGKLQAVQQHNGNPKEGHAAARDCNPEHATMGDCVAAAGSILSNPTIKQLLQLLEQLQLRHGQLAALQASLARRLHSAASSEIADLAQHLVKELSAAGLLDHHIALQQPDRQQHAASDAAELAAFVDVQVLMTAMLLVTQAVAGFDQEAVQGQVQQCWEDLALRAARDPAAVTVRLHMVAGDVVTTDDSDKVLASVPDALVLLANTAWLLHCRHQDGVSYQDLQQLRYVLDKYCGGPVPRSQHQLNQLSSAGKAGIVCQAEQPEQQLEQLSECWQFHGSFLAQLKQVAQGVGPTTPVHSSCLAGALRAVQLNGPAYLQNLM